MILLLLIILAVILWLIQSDLEATDSAEQSVETACPACRKTVDMDWMVCPHCQKRLREACSYCHQGKLISHHYCPFCGSTQEREA